MLKYFLYKKKKYKKLLNHIGSGSIEPNNKNNDKHLQLIESMTSHITEYKKNNNDEHKSELLRIKSTIESVINKYKKLIDKANGDISKYVVKKEYIINNKYDNYDMTIQMIDDLLKEYNSWDSDNKAKSYGEKKKNIDDLLKEYNSWDSDNKAKSYGEQKKHIDDSLEKQNEWESVNKNNLLKLSNELVNKIKEHTDNIERIRILREKLAKIESKIKEHTDNIERIRILREKLETAETNTKEQTDKPLFNTDLKEIQYIFANYVKVLDKKIERYTDIITQFNQKIEYLQTKINEINEVLKITVV